MHLIFCGVALKMLFCYSKHSRGSLEYFYKNIGFEIKRKQDKLRDVLSQYKNQKYTTPRYEIIKMVPVMIELRKAGRTKKEIANHLGIDRMVVYRELQKCLRESKNVL